MFHTLEVKVGQIRSIFCIYRELTNIFKVQIAPRRLTKDLCVTISKKKVQSNSFNMNMQYDKLLGRLYTGVTYEDRNYLCR